MDYYEFMTAIDWCIIKIMSIIKSCENDVNLIQIYHFNKLKKKKNVIYFPRDKSCERGAELLFLKILKLMMLLSGSIFCSKSWKMVSGLFC